jgi:biliverdin reductase
VTKIITTEIDRPMIPLKVGIVGTGYAAKQRVTVLSEDRRVESVLVAGNDVDRVAEFAANYSVVAIDSWQELIQLPELDLIFVCTVNSQHGTIARAAIEADKNVVVEYPLALDLHEAASIVTLAKAKHKLLHIEHIELIGGLHRAIVNYLPEIGNVFYARYATLSGDRSVTRNWKYDRQRFGFPLAAALSRIHRLTDLFGTVSTVSCQNRYWDIADTDYFTACLCDARLVFSNGIIADVTYGKGNIFWHPHRTFEIHGDRGTLLFEGETGTVIRDRQRTAIEVVSRRGLFAKDTAMVLDNLISGTSLYVNPNASLYALQVAESARIASITERIVTVSN